MLTAFRSFKDGVFNLILPARMSGHDLGEIEQYQRSDARHELVASATQVVDCAKKEMIDRDLSLTEEQRLKHLAELDVVASLQTYSIFYRQQSYMPPDDDTRYVLFSLGNGDSAKRLCQSVMQGEYAALGSNVCFQVSDYRGAHRSTGELNSTADLPDDLIFQAKDLLQKNPHLKPENIILYGHSLGAGVAVEAANRLHAEGIRVRIIHSRSFDELYHVPLAMLYDEAQSIYPGLVVGSVVTGLSSAACYSSCPSVTTSVLGSSAVASAAISREVTNGMFSINAFKAWKGIPDDYKMCYYAVGDKIIKQKGASLYDRLEKEGDTAPYRYLVHCDERSGYADNVHNAPDRYLYTEDGKPILSIVSDFIWSNPAPILDNDRRKDMACR